MGSWAPFVVPGLVAVIAGLLLTFWPQIHDTKFGRDLVHFGEVMSSLMIAVFVAALGAAVMRLHELGQPGAKPWGWRERCLAVLSCLFCAYVANGFCKWIGAPEEAGIAMAGLGGAAGAASVVVRALDVVFSALKSRLGGSPPAGGE